MIELPETQPGRQRLSRRDWRMIAVALLLAAGSIVVVARYFESAFPEASIEFRYDRSSSRPLAETLLRAQGVDVSEMKHAVRFDADHRARIFLERTLGLDEARKVLRDDIRVWSWHHRWFRPLVEEEFSVDIAPTGEIIGYDHKLPEDHDGGGSLDPQQGTLRASGFLSGIGISPADLTLVSTSERRLPNRLQRILTFDAKTIHPGGASYRHIVTLDGVRVTGYAQQLKVPDGWLRSYAELRSKNAAAGRVDTIFNVLLMIGAAAVFVIRLRRGDLSLRFLLAIGIATIVLVGGVALNSLPSELAWYDTTTSYGAFIGQLLFFRTLMPAIGMAMMLIVICGSGEVLYRERLPHHLAIPRIWTRKALTSRRVFLAMVLGYALVPMFMAYQTGFYLIAGQFGAWAPAEVPYDDMLNTALPWLAVLFAGFFPAFSEEFLSRAFAIPFLQRILHSRWFAIVLAGFIWGFGHSTYPNQPFWIRGVEVGIAGVVAGLMMDRVGLLPLLIWHYTIDAVYTATLLFASGNTYYVVSAVIASLIFAVPLLLSIALYVRNRGFVPDDDLTNASMPVPEPGDEAETDGDAATPPMPAVLPSPELLTRNRLLAGVAIVALAAAALAIRPDSPEDVSDYRVTKNDAKAVARKFVPKYFERVVATPSEGFRSWNHNSSREDGGGTGGFDAVAATWLVRQGLGVEGLQEVLRDQIEAATWMVRFFTPLEQEEVYVEVDARQGKVIGYHKVQADAKPGPDLPQHLALAIAGRTFARFDLDQARFDLKETLTFAQPNRRDWLFHFDERTPLLPGAWRRVTVRVAGAEVTQFQKTIRVPESVYREAATQTAQNIILIVLWIGGTVALLSLVIAGLVIATRRAGLPWRRPLRWTLMLSVLPILSLLAQHESMLFSYSTSVGWDTFRVTLITRFVTDAGLQIGLLFLALAGLEATVPYLSQVLTHEGRARFGRSALVAALTALALLVVAEVAGTFLAHAFPAAAIVDFGVFPGVATPLPALTETMRAVIAVIVLCGAVALYTAALRRHAAIITIAAVFSAAIEPFATSTQTPLILARGLALGILAWVIARFILRGNPLAWPLFVFLGVTLSSASDLLGNARPDLRANALALFVIAVLVAAWIASPSVKRGKAHARVV